MGACKLPVIFSKMALSSLSESEESSSISRVNDKCYNPLILTQKYSWKYRIISINNNNSTFIFIKIKPFPLLAPSVSPRSPAALFPEAVTSYSLESPTLLNSADYSPSLYSELNSPYSY